MKSMKQNILLFYLLISAIFLGSCQKDLDEFIPDPTSGPDSTWYNIINNSMPVNDLKARLLLDIHRDSLALTNASTTYLTGSDLQLAIPAAALSSLNNIPVTGTITLESHLIKKKGDYIRMGIPTISNGRMLVSGGAFFIRLLKDGNELKVTQQNNIIARFPDPAPSSLMKKFDGDESNPVSFNWLQNQDTAFNNVSVLNQSYQVSTNTLRWINCDYFYDTSGIQQTSVYTILPYNYTNANSIAFTVFNDIRSVVGMYGNATTRKFSTGRLPVNKLITVVVISKQGNDYFLGHELALTNGVPGTVGFMPVTITPVITTLDNIKAYLDTL